MAAPSGGGGGGAGEGSSSAAAAATIGVHGVDQEAMWQMNLEEAMELGPYPERVGEPDCSYYMRTGMCRFGMTCKFNHPADRKLAVAAARMKGEYPQRIGQPECQYYLKTGTCKFGATCKFHHPREKAAMATRVQLNELGYPLRPNEKECAYYLRTGQCKFGSTCKFHHSQPSTMMVAVRGSVYSPGQSATSPGQHAYQGAVTSWPLSRSASFIASPRWPGHSSYAQVIVPPGLVQVPGWSPYTAQIGSSSSEDQQRTPGAAQYYTGSRQSGTSIGDQGMFSSYQAGSVPVGLYAVQRENLFPERPDQPECQFYMKTGDCKFGAVCKFHHPRERIIPTPNCALSPLGLPLRPGEPICSFYNRYGMCKFGPNCKFDHPMGNAMYGQAPSPASEAPAPRRMLAHVPPSHPEASPDGGSGRSRRIAHSDSQQIPSGERSAEREAS
ncbi:zinc finger CCCH domain-containing protein 33 isoform X1 [Zea mays]|uniref:C3H1-type domain-containing protein n=1 Tax=Zea mays TaxID=4577 RepID=C0P5S4_MAIZE|nr:zinc finger CCCH domain-containing protein 33 isoform X1 [Zea mays]ACN28340.1 unknown [Zea mays]|eukprot:XP_008676803.1 zinc finger CCCH domain-containing protein 33 isoform X1 [Zea mays]